ncbi:MAG: peptidylprolyl isomerase [Prevotellaceae bacterium]|nr:peptidylprolyl isomerase [Prevotellaceae bacterium]MDD6111162.1 peptidylprolyl isomerase [Prevotellaceae bacterium]MDD6780380.1 peptidylprolyl isomerase [Prevotellaceae bacterium]
MDKENNKTRVRIKTSMGDIVVRLYDETPKHRDNFVKLAKEGYFDGTLFHRVIRDFMIQGGDPDSKGAPAGKNLGTGGPDYTIPAEFVFPKLYHKRGALSAARTGDEVNPNRESSGSQFYIVWGKTYKPAELKQMERQLAMQQEQAVFNQLVADNKAKIMELRRNRDRAGLQELQDDLIASTKAICAEKGLPKFTDEQVESYTTVGGTPFLDNQYTVFGEVEEGLEIVGKIQEVETGRNDRPKDDVVMLSVEVI